MASRVTCFLSLTLLLSELVTPGRAGLEYIEGVGTPDSASLPGPPQTPSLGSRVRKSFKCRLRMWSRNVART